MRLGAVALAAVLAFAVCTSGLPAGEAVSHARAVAGATGVPPELRHFLPARLPPGNLRRPLPADFPLGLPPCDAVLASGRVPQLPVAPVGKLRGEFEKQQAILLGGDQMVREMPDLFAEIVLHCRDRVEVIVLVSGEANRKQAALVLDERHVTAPHVHFLEIAHDSMWTRDFGPQAVLEKNGRAVLVDCWYSTPDRADDDAVPAILAKALEIPVIESPLVLDGGNLVTNGRGLLVATYGLVSENLSPKMSVDDIRASLGHAFGVTEVVFLKPLIGEPTGHVDMFVTFPSAYTVVVGEMSPEVDAENAAILDENAARLASVRVNGRKLRVVRVPMPDHDDEVWRTYTNVVYLNGLVLVPTYPATSPDDDAAALAAYRKLLPRWRVQAVNAEALAELGGALHCVTMNLSGLGKTPKWPVVPKAEEPLPMGGLDRLRASRLGADAVQVD